eukprot:7379465-Prymnesium_polylepis.1
MRAHSHPAWRHWAWVPLDSPEYGLYYGGFDFAPEEYPEPLPVPRCACAEAGRLHAALGAVSLAAEATPIC